MLASDVLKDVRSFVNDDGKKRYTDDYLIRLLNEGLLDLSKRLRIFKSEVSIPFSAGQSVYNLPLDFIEFEDVAVNGDISVKFQSYRQIEERYGSSWRTITTGAEPGVIIYDKQSMYQYRAFPTPDGTGLYDLFLSNDAYGVITSIEGFDSPDYYGMLTYADTVLNKVLYAPGGSSGNLDTITNQVNLLAEQVSQYSQTISSNSVAIQQISGLVASADSKATSAELNATAAINQVNALQVTVDDITGDVTSLASQVSTLTASVSSISDGVDAATDAATAAQQTANSAVSTANDVKARIDNVNGDASHVTIETLASNVTNLSSSVTLAQQTATQAGNAAANAGSIASGAATTAGSALGIANTTKSRIDSINGGISLETLSNNVTTLASNLTSVSGTATAAFTLANSTSITVDGLIDDVTALASSVSTLSTTVGENSSSITVLQESVTDLENANAKWEVVTNVNDLTNGFGIYNDGTIEQVVFRTNNFKIYPNTGTSNPFTFAIEGGKVVIPNAMITNVIQSDNFVTGVSGWKIDKETGSAEFRNITARGNIQATSLNAATGTFSGSLTADAVNAVTTLNIADQSIVIDSSYYNANDISLSSANTTIATKSITMSNASNNSTISLHASFSIKAIGIPNHSTFLNDTIVFGIYRDGTLLSTRTKVVPYTPDSGTSMLFGEYAIDFLDAPGAGTFNYQIQFLSDTVTPTLTAYDRYLLVSGGKR